MSPTSSYGAAFLLVSTMMAMMDREVLVWALGTLLSIATLLTVAILLVKGALAAAKAATLAHLVALLLLIPAVFVESPAEYFAWAAVSCMTTLAAVSLAFLLGRPIVRRVRYAVRLAHLYVLTR